VGRPLRGGCTGLGGASCFGPPVGRDLDGAQHSSRKAEERGDEFEGAANYDADETEGKQDEPDERIEDQGCEGQGPAKEGEEAKEKEVEHRVCVS
jgi:hypothetical protein